MAGKKLITNLLGSAVDALGNKIGALPDADLLDNLFWGEKDGDNIVYKNTPNLSNDLAETVADKLNSLNGIEADVGTSNVSASSYVNVNFGTVDEDGDIEEIFDSFKLRFSDHDDRYGSNKTIRFDDFTDDIYDFDEYVETKINKEYLSDMIKNGLDSVLSFGKVKAHEANKDGYLTSSELSKFLNNFKDAQAAVPAMPSIKKETRGSPENSYDVLTYLDETSGEPLGEMYLRKLRDGSNEVASVTVNPETRRQGVATALYNAAGISAPSDNISLDAFNFWKNRDPNSLPDSLYNYYDDLIGLEIPDMGLITDVRDNFASVKKGGVSGPLYKNQLQDMGLIPKEPK
tara:strand:- start:43 stop:1080 length:1038 start_codon:yes stop_codon:yes gene_type:complete